MGGDRRKDIVRHLTEEELETELRDCNDAEMVRRLGFIRNLYQGDTIAEAASRVGKSQPTGGRWADRWNQGGIDGLEPDTSDGRPPKLDEDDQNHLRELLEADQPWTTQEVRALIKDEFNVTYHPNYIHELLRSLGMNYAKPRPERPERPENADKILEERVEETLEKNEDDEPVTDGGYVVGFSTRRGPSQPTTASESGRSTRHDSNADSSK